MFKLPDQLLWFIPVPHENTWTGAFIWWIRRENKYCRSFCPKCKYYFRCQEDIALERMF